VRQAALLASRRAVLVTACLATLLAPLALPAAAGAHAVLEQSQPGRGDQLPRAPKRVVLHFDEAVEVAFGAVRVYDAQGRRVDTGSTRHPRGRGDSVAVDLRRGLHDGVYTATYRVISADSHPVTGGFTFTVGSGGGAPASSVADLIDAGGAGPVTQAAFGAVRGLCYLAIALAAGGLVFVLAVWGPALRGHAGAGEEWRAASDAFAARARTVGLAAAVAGVVSSALGLVLQGATAGATSFWGALDLNVLGDVIGTRFGTVWSLRLVAFAAIGTLLALPALGSEPRLRPASLGAAGLVMRDTPMAVRLVAGALAAFLCLTPALAGHASTVDPLTLLVPANFTHVSAMTVWVGGVATLLLAVPAATRHLEPPERTSLLASAVTRFSTVAILAVAALVGSGVAQAIPELESLADLTDTAFGRALLAKGVLLVLLLALGAWNRQRARPRLAQLAARHEPPGQAGALLRRSLRAEALLMVSVLGVTAALVSYPPPSSARGPFADTLDIGPARLELTVDPARPGANELHMYLFRKSDGAQYDRVKELHVSASLPDREIGPLHLRADKAGPGHYVVRRAQLAPAGDWKLELLARVSSFDEYPARVEVPIK
jgi:copper transport protein